MTKTREQTSSGASGDLPKAVAPSTGVGRYLSQAMRWRPDALLRWRPTALLGGGAASQSDAAAAKPKRSEWNRFFLAMLAYLIGSIVIEYALLAANSFFKLHLEKVQNLVPTTWPIIGGMSKYSLLYVMLLAALIWLLYRTGIMPRDLFGARAAQQRRAAGGADASSSGADTSSASRRHSARKLSALVSTTPVPRRKTNSRRSTTTTSARASATAASTGAGNHDNEYLRVRASQRSRRRKH